MQRCDRIWRNARIATLSPSREGLGIIENGFIAARDGRIVAVGGQYDQADDQSDPSAFQSDGIIDCEGRWITPGLIDCHTHLVHGGDRAREFEMRLAGATYEEIARAGGGIVSTMTATRAASEAELVATALPCLDALLAEGVTTVEVKSGYGLSRDAEMKSLRAARALAGHRDVEIVTTFLGAHALPPEYNGDKDAYIDAVATDMLPAIAGEGLADAVDAF